MNESRRVQIGDRIIGASGNREAIGKYIGFRKGTGHILKEEGTDKEIVIVTARVIQPAQLPSKPTRPNPSLVSEIEKLKQNPHVSRAQLKTLLEVTDNDITKLKVGRMPGQTGIWVVHRGRRYDINKDGGLSNEKRIGRKNQAAPQSSMRTAKCPQCGTSNSFPVFSTRVDCSKCGCELRHVVVKRKK